MGLFDGLLERKTCDICGGKCGVLGGTKVGNHEIWGGVPAKFIKKTAPNQAESYAAHYAQYAKDYLEEDKN